MKWKYFDFIMMGSILTNVALMSLEHYPEVCAHQQGILGQSGSQLRYASAARSTWPHGPVLSAHVAFGPYS